MVLCHPFCIILTHRYPVEVDSRYYISLCLEYCCTAVCRYKRDSCRCALLCCHLRSVLVEGEDAQSVYSLIDHGIYIRDFLADIIIGIENHNLIAVFLSSHLEAFDVSLVPGVRTRCDVAVYLASCFTCGTRKAEPTAYSSNQKNGNELLHALTSFCKTQKLFIDVIFNHWMQCCQTENS